MSVSVDVYVIPVTIIPTNEQRLINFWLEVTLISPNNAALGAHDTSAVG